MGYVLMDFTVESRDTILRNCDDFERKRLSKKLFLDRLLDSSIFGWALEKSEFSYLFRTVSRGDPRESLRQDYHFFFAGKFHYIVTNGRWPLTINYKKSEVLKDEIAGFESSLLNAFKVHGISGYLDKENVIFDMHVVGE